MNNSMRRAPEIPQAFWLLALLGFIIPSATILQNLAVAWQLSNTGALTTVFPTMVAVGAATRIVSGFPVAHLVRQRGAAACCHWALWGESTTLLAMAVALSGTGSIWLLVPLEMASSFIFTVLLISRQTLVRNVLARSQGSEAASGISRALAYVSKLILPAVGGSILVLVNSGTALAFCSGVLAVGALLFRSRMSGYGAGSGDGDTGAGFVRSVGKSFAFYRENAGVLEAVIQMSLFNFTLAPLAVIIPLHIAGLASATSLDLGLSEACLGGGAVCGALLFSRIRGGTPSMLLLPLATANLSLMISVWLGEGVGHLLFNASLFVVAMSVAYSGSLFDAFFIKSIPGDIYTSIVGVQMVIIGVSYPLGLVVSSWFLGERDSIAIVPGYNAVLVLAVFALLQVRLARRGTRCQCRAAGADGQP